MLATQKYEKLTKDNDNFKNECLLIFKEIINIWEKCSDEEWKAYFPVHEGNHPRHRQALSLLKKTQYKYGPIKYGDVKDQAPLPEIKLGDYQLFYSEVWGYTVDFKGHQAFQLGH